MILDRSDEKNIQTARFHAPFYHCFMIVRQDLSVINADESYYLFVGENSFRPVTDLIEPEDAAYLKQAVEHLEEPVEVLTRITNLLDEGKRHVWIRLQNTEQTEDGGKLYRMDMTDAADSLKRNHYLQKQYMKYRYFMSIKDESYFEYDPAINRFSIYNVVNSKTMLQVREDLDGYRDRYLEEHGGQEKNIEQMNRLYAFLKEHNNSFEMNWVEQGENGLVHSTYKGGTNAYNPELVTGVITSYDGEAETAYYLTAAGRDSFTGLLNKKAFIEYATDRLDANPDSERTQWMLIMDIDDFKSINDRYGHAAGDAAIRKVADTLQFHLGAHGIVGRYGGDEFVALLHDVDDRETLKLRLKVVAKDLICAFDGRFKLTVSMGVAQYPKDGSTFTDLFNIADKALYIAKEKGKNRHIIYDAALHADFDQHANNKRVVSIVMSHENRRQMLMDLIGSVHREGADFFLKHSDNCQNVLEAFDLDGLTIYGDYGNQVLLRYGAYTAEPEKRAEVMCIPGYADLYRNGDIFVLTMINKLHSISEFAYEEAARQEIGASVRMVIRKEGVPYLFLDFDVFNTNRKWSDADLDLMTLFGSALGAELT